MAEEAQGVKETVEVNTTTTESPTDENTSLQIEDDLGFGDDEGSSSGTDENEEKTDDSSDENEAEEESEKSAESGEKDSENIPKGAEKRKQQLNTEIRDAVAERNALRAEIDALNKQKYQLQKKVPEINELMEQVNPETGEYYTRLEAEIAQIRAEREAEKEQAELNAYTEQIVENNLRLANEAEQVMRDFPIFDPNSAEFDADLSAEADKLLNSALIIDKNTQRVIGSKVSPYELYKTVAMAANKARVNGEVKGRKAAQEMMGSTDIIGSAGQTTQAEDDDFLKGFAEDF